jgi:predicted nucleic acid-binding protein
MNKEKVYFDTSVPSAYFDERTPERMYQTKEFWRKMDKYDLYVSTLVEDELSQVSDKLLRDDLSKLINACSVLDLDDQVMELAQAYVKAGILPQKYFSDAQHIAVAVVNGIKFLVSWNFKHFVNVKTRQMVNLVNLKEGYGVVEIIAPPEF